MRNPILRCFAAAFCAAAFASASFGQTVYESFSGTPGSSTGQTGGTGFGGAYTGAGNVVGQGLNYGNLQTAGGAFTTAGNNSGAFRLLGTPINTDTAGPVYVSFLSAVGQGTVPDYAGLSFFSNGTNDEELFLGKPTGSGNYGFDVSGVAGGVQTGSVAAATTPAFLVYRLNFTPTGETIDFFANPTPGGTLPATPSATFTIPQGSFADALTSLRLQSGNGAGGATPFSFDEIRIGSTYASVSPVVPEPGALGLAAACAAAGLRRRRR